MTAKLLWEMAVFSNITVGRLSNHTCSCSVLSDLTEVIREFLDLWMTRFRHKP